jgi:hypothetical protein
MYFRCANSVCAEDIAMEAGALSKSIKRRQNPFAWGTAPLEEPDFFEKVVDLITFKKWKLTDKTWKLTFLPNYIALILEFSQRTLSFSQDRLKAIHGVLQTLDPSDRAFPGGLPQAWLAETLLWQPREKSRYSIDIKAGGIPTWSWAAWLFSEGCVWSEYANSHAIIWGDPQTTIHVQEDRGSIKSYCLMTKIKNLKVYKTTPDKLSKNARQLLKSSGTLLSFQTSLCVLQIEEVILQQNVPEDLLKPYYLVDSELNRIGKVWTCDHVVKASRKHHFIALSSRSTGSKLAGAVAGKYIPQSSDSEGTTSNDSPSSWRVTNVMLVVWSGDVAFRVAVGQVISTAWDEKTRKLVFLG